MKRFVLILCLLLIAVPVIASIIVGKGGISMNNGLNVGSSGISLGSISNIFEGTYWGTSYTVAGSWDTAYTATWNTSYNTEIP